MFVPFSHFRLDLILRIKLIEFFSPLTYTYVHTYATGRKLSRSFTIGLIVVETFKSIALGHILRRWKLINKLAFVRRVCEFCSYNMVYRYAKPN